MEKRARLAIVVCVLTIAGLLAVWIGWNYRVVNMRRQALATLKSHPMVIVDTATASQPRQGIKGQVPIVRRLLGDVPVRGILFRQTPYREAFATTMRLFPEANVEILKPREQSGPPAQ